MQVQCAASHGSRSSSVSDHWRTSWREELESSVVSGSGAGNSAVAERFSGYSTATNGNGNGNGNGHHHHDDDDGGMHNDWAGEDASASSNSWYGQPEPEAQEEAPAWGARSWRDERGSWGSDEGTGAAAASRLFDANEDEAEEEPTDEAPAGPSLFNDAFKDALKAALARSPLFGTDGPGSGGEEDMEPQPSEATVTGMETPLFTDSFRAALKESLVRQQAEMDARAGFASDDEYVPVATPYVSKAYVPAPPKIKDMSPLEEVIYTALNASKHNLRRLTLVRAELDAAIERETKQVERLDFAMNKSANDIAYYKTLEKLSQQRNK